MQSNARFGNLAESYPQRKEAKEIKSSKALSHMAIGSKGITSTVNPVSSSDKSKGNERPTPNAQKKAARTEARRSVEIDEFLLQLLMENMIDEAYWKFHTKCIYRLGITKYNTLLIEARNGRNPKRLLAFKLKGALELHYKKQIYRETYISER